MMKSNERCSWFTEIPKSLKRALYRWRIRCWVIKVEGIPLAQLVWSTQQAMRLTNTVIHFVWIWKYLLYERTTLASCAPSVLIQLRIGDLFARFTMRLLHTLRGLFAGRSQIEISNPTDWRCSYWLPILSGVLSSPYTLFFPYLFVFPMILKITKDCRLIVSYFSISFCVTCTIRRPYINPLTYAFRPVWVTSVRACA